MTTPLDELGALVTTLLGNLQLAHRAYAAGATDRPISIWLREAERSARQIDALRRGLLGTDDTERERGA